MTALDIACVVVAWVLVAFAAATVPGRLRHARPVQIPPPYPPPVPPSRRATDDWMALVPVECLSDDEIGLRCADIEAREGWVA